MGTMMLIAVWCTKVRGRQSVSKQKTQKFDVERERGREGERERERLTCNGSLGTVSDYGLKQVCSFGELI
jgi:hypothetical protein